MTWRMTHGKTDSPAVQRLGQYEDTGLTPEEIRELRREDNRYQTFNPD